MSALRCSLTDDGTKTSLPSSCTVCIRHRQPLACAICSLWEAAALPVTASLAFSVTSKTGTHQLGVLRQHADWQVVGGVAGHHIHITYQLHTKLAPVELHPARPIKGFAGPFQT